jgi:hypothetical protein
VIEGGEYRISKPLRIPQMNANMQFGRGSLVADPAWDPGEAPNFLFIIGEEGGCKYVLWRRVARRSRARVYLSYVASCVRVYDPGFRRVRATLISTFPSCLWMVPNEHPVFKSMMSWASQLDRAGMCLTQCRFLSCSCAQSMLANTREHTKKQCHLQRSTSLI